MIMALSAAFAVPATKSRRLTLRDDMGIHLELMGATESYDKGREERREKRDERRATSDERSQPSRQGPNQGAGFSRLSSLVSRVSRASPLSAIGRRLHCLAKVQR